LKLNNSSKASVATCDGKIATAANQAADDDDEESGAGAD
jgi:hypothetical protein